MFKYGVISSPYFPLFSPSTGKDGPEITPYMDTFHAVIGNLKAVNQEDTVLKRSFKQQSFKMF